MKRYEDLKDSLNNIENTFEHKNTYIETTTENLIKYFDKQFHPNSMTMSKA